MNGVGMDVAKWKVPEDEAQSITHSLLDALEHRVGCAAVGTLKVAVLDRMVFYVRATDDRENVILVVVNLDPHHEQGGWLSVPLEEIGIEPESTYQVHDLLGDGRYLWQGDRNYVSLDPRESPAQILRLRRRIRTERDFDYYY